MRRRVLETVHFDEQTFRGFHLYDLDFTFSAYLAGFRLAVCNDLAIIHDSQGDFGPSWRPHAQLFYQKHASRFFSMARRPFCISLVRVRTKQEALEVMTPDHWFVM